MKLDARKAKMKNGVTALKSVMSSSLDWFFQCPAQPSESQALGAVWKLS